MATELQTGGMAVKEPRSVYVGEELWQDVQEAAFLRTREEGRHVSASEILRRGAIREIRAVHDDGEYEIPTQAG